MVNREKVPEAKDFTLPNQKSREEIENAAFKSSNVQSNEKVEDTYKVPSPKSLEDTYKRLDVPVLSSREKPNSSYDVPTQKSKETTRLDTFQMPIVE
jgi:hypothetical protein